MPRAEHILERRGAGFGDLDRPAPWPPANPVPREGKIGDRGADPSCQMRTPFAPVQTGPAERAPAARGRIEVNAVTGEELPSRRGQCGAVGIEFEPAPLDHGLRDGDAKFAGEMVVAGPRGSKGRVSRAHREPWLGRLEIRCHLHDGFHHLRHAR